MKLRIGNSAIMAYRRLPYRPWYALAEFVDNSTDVYKRPSNKSQLDAQLQKDGEVLSVEISYKKEDDLLRIVDNSMGMNQEELDSGLIIGNAPKETAGRAEFGMGMKTAAIWFADNITIRTKKLGEDYECQVTIDVPKFAKGEDDLNFIKTPAAKEMHYTIIELTELKRQIIRTSMKKTQDFLASIYREDIRNNRLNLVVNNEKLEAPTSKDDNAFMERSDGSKVLVEIENMEVNGKIVNGWVGVLKPGYTGRNYAGFALIRFDRAVRGWLDAWRPFEIFGDARNDKLNQRIAGELIMDQFTASHTKDGIDWEADDEDVLGQKLRDFCDQHDIIRVAKQKTRGDENEETSIERTEAREQIQAQLNDTRVTDVIVLMDVPKPELAKFKANVLLQAADNVKPVGNFTIDSAGRQASLFEIELSPNDPYYEYEVMENRDLRVIINSSHPAYELLDSSEARVAHYHHVLFDAISEWKCTQLHSEMAPESIRLMKDSLFRVVSEVATQLD
jgi:hypothetical protein